MNPNAEIESKLVGFVHTNSNTETEWKVAWFVINSNNETE